MRLSILLVSLLITVQQGAAQVQNSQQNEMPIQQKDQVSIPVATQWTLDAAGVPQRAAIKSVALLYCPVTHMKGSGFLLKNGLVITNNHVVDGCTVGQIVGVTSIGHHLNFRKLATDADVDLAALRPTEAIAGGLELGLDIDPELGSVVSTWGYPLSYNGPAPLLSVGYVARFAQRESHGKSVKHIVVNGAFNPGNSGGPVFRSNDDKVIGVVVAKLLPYSARVKKEIAAFEGIYVVWMPVPDENGHVEMVPQGKVLQDILDEFYKGTQVMIGEAISVSELRVFLAAKEAELQ